MQCQHSFHFQAKRTQWRNVERKYIKEDVTTMHWHIWTYRTAEIITFIEIVHHQLLAQTKIKKIKSRDPTKNRIKRTSSRFKHIGPIWYSTLLHSKNEKIKDKKNREKQWIISIAAPSDVILKSFQHVHQMMIAQINSL